LQIKNGGSAEVLGPQPASGGQDAPLSSPQRM